MEEDENRHTEETQGMVGNFVGIFKQLREILTTEKNLRRMRIGHFFAPTEKTIETSPCYFAEEKLEIERNREEERTGKVEIDIIEDSVNTDNGEKFEEDENRTHFCPD